MSPKHHFLYRLAVRLEAAESKAAANPDDSNASIYAQSLRELHASLSAYPQDHTFFQQWGKHPWEPVALSDQANSEDFQRADSLQLSGQRPQQGMPSRKGNELQAAFLSAYCA